MIAGIEVVAAPTEDPGDPDFLTGCGPWLDHPRSWTPNMARHPEKFTRVSTAIADAEGPVLVHCAGGRDRTGMVCSMLLALTGVEPGAVAQNYERGFRAAAAHAGQAMSYLPSTGCWAYDQFGHEWRPEQLDEALAQRIPELLRWVEGTTSPATYSRRASMHGASTGFGVSFAPERSPGTRRCAAPASAHAAA